MRRSKTHKKIKLKVDSLLKASGHPCNREMRTVSQWTGFKGFWRWLHLTMGTEDFTLEKRNSKLCTQSCVNFTNTSLPPLHFTFSLYSTFLILYRLDCVLSGNFTLTQTLSCPFHALWKFTSWLKTNSPAHCMKLHFKRVRPLFHNVWSLHSGLFAPLQHGE
jgi:hypothetical protein